MSRFNIFKSQKKWAKHFEVDNFLALHMRFLRHSSWWPINFANHLPIQLHWLSVPLQWSYFLAAVLVSFHLMVLFFYSIFYELFLAKNITLSIVSDCVIQSLVHSFACCATLYYKYNHKKCKEIIDSMNKNFKMRSAIGKFIFFYCNT